MAKSKNDILAQDEDRAVREFHNANSKGRQKQQVESLIKHNWDSFEDWDDEPIETFQKFSKRSRR